MISHVEKRKVGLQASSPPVTLDPHHLIGQSGFAPDVRTHMVGVDLHPSKMRPDRQPDANMWFDRPESDDNIERVNAPWRSLVDVRPTISMPHKTGILNATSQQ